MRRAAILLILLGLTGPAATLAGPCDDEAVGRTGGWIQGDDAGGAGNPVTARHKAQIRPILDAMAELVKKAYPEPVGSQGKLSRNYGLESFAGGDLATYELVANFKGYGCDRSRNPNGVVGLLSETATWLYLQVNSFWSGSSGFEYPQHFLSSGDHQNLYTLQPARVLRTPSPADAGRKKIDATLPASITAYPNFVHEGQYDSWEKSYNTREVSHIVFVTPDGKLPYEPVTIGEFLDVNEARLAAYVRENEQYGGVEYQQELLGRIPALRSRYATRLGDTAYIESSSWSESGLAKPQPFVGPEGYMLARRVARYAGGGDPYRPRFITVFWRWQPEVPYSVRMHEAIKNHLDFAALRDLLAE